MYHVIINPASRSGKGKHLWLKLIEPYLMEHKIEYISYFSHTPGDVTKIAATITKDATKENPKSIIILGGDGTVNEVLQGIRDFRTVILGYVPTGSSNDLARDLGISKNPLQAVEKAFFSGTVQKMDVGCVSFPDGEKRYFAVSGGIGFDAAVCEETNRSAFKKILNRIKLGKLAYLTIAIKQLFAAKATTCQLTLDNGHNITLSPFLFTTGMLHCYEGGGFKFCPDAKPDDGILDICCVDTKLPKLAILMALPTAFLGKHYIFPGITAYRAKEFTIISSTPLWIHTDGEVLRTDTEVTFTCLKRVLSIKH